MSWSALTDNLTKATVKTFGQPVTYQPLSLPAVSLMAIFDDKYQAVDPDSGAIITSTQPMLRVRIADLPRNPLQGDLVTISGVTYRVNDFEPDGGGGAMLLLHKNS